MSEGLRYLDHTLQTRPSRGLPSLVLIAVVGLVNPHAGSGQVIQGYVLEDSTRVEVAHASVSLLRSDSVLKVTSTDSEGWFSFTLSDPGTYNLKASRLGYETTTTSPINAGPSDILTVEFVLRAKPVPMEPIVVIAGRGRGSSRFYERMETWGKGIFMTPSMIDSINPRHPADVLRGQEETWLSWQQGRWTLVPRIRTYLGNGCVNYVLDGRRIDPDLWGPVWTESPLSWISGKDVIAVEFYRYVGEAPPELRRFARDCGLLVFWTSLGW
jgi:hypothetical protein